MRICPFPETIDLILIAKLLHEIISFVNAVAWVQAWPKFHQLFVILYDLLSPVLWVQFLGVFRYSAYGSPASVRFGVKCVNVLRCWSEIWDHTNTLSIKKCTITNRDEVTSNASCSFRCHLFILFIASFWSNKFRCNFASGLFFASYFWQKILLSAMLWLTFVKNFLVRFSGHLIWRNKGKSS